MDRYVLLVEDQPTHAKLFSEMLKVSGYASVVTLTGREGVALARSRTPSLVIVDIILPDLDGREVIAELRGSSVTETAPILAISAVSDRAMERDCLAIGADAFLSKPVGLDRFTSTVERLLVASGLSR